METCRIKRHEDNICLFIIFVVLGFALFVLSYITKKIYQTVKLTGAEIVFFDKFVLRYILFFHCTPKRVINNHIIIPNN